MADVVVPQEYGTTLEEKLSVGVKICRGLLEKIKYDLSVARTDNEVDMRYMVRIALTPICISSLFEIETNYSSAFFVM